MLSILPLAAALLIGGVAHQDDEVDLSRLEIYLDKAVNGSAYIRPQAAARLIPMGAVAAERIHEIATAGPDAMAVMGADLVEVMGAFDDDRLRALLWNALADPDFPWRPAAARSLADNPLGTGPEREVRQFHALLTDPIAPVRAASIGYFGRVFSEPVSGPRDSMSANIEARLSDPSDYVRRAAALTLVGWGDQEKLWWVYEDLERTDTFFDSWTGKNAAYESRRALIEVLGDTFGYDPELPPSHPTNDQALKAIRAKINERTGVEERPELPEVARASGPIEGTVLGLELISCRRGESFLRWTEDDHLIVGMGNAARVKLPEGTTKRLMDLARTEVARLERPFYGKPGCDMEKLRFVTSPGQPASSWFVSKGQARVEGLRPEPLGRVLRGLVESIPADLDASEDARLENLRQRARETMLSVGGA